MDPETESLSPAPATAGPGHYGPPETPSPVATIAIVAVCLPLPLLMGIGLVSHALTGPDPNGFDLIFFFTYLPLLVLSIALIEPLVLFLNIRYTNRATSGPVAPIRLIVCWAAFIMHSLVLLWLMTPHGRRA